MIAFFFSLTRLVNVMYEVMFKQQAFYNTSFGSSVKSGRTASFPRIELQQNLQNA